MPTPKTEHSQTESVPCNNCPPGWCRRHRMVKTQHLVDLCRASADYRQLWDRMASQLIKGPGDYLHDALKRWTGQGFSARCHCRDTIGRMNREGPQWCRNNVEWVRGRIRKEAAARGWWKYAVTIPGAKWFLKELILQALRDFEKTTEGEE